VVVAFAATIATIVAFWALQPRLEAGLFDLVLATKRLEALHDLNLLVLLTACLLLLPVAVGISVVRYRLWDIELLINRALVYGALTAMVAGTFMVGTVGLGSLLAGTIGGGRGVAGVITGVVLMLVFQPVRRRVQSSVDRRFYRQKYDAERSVERFTGEVGELVRPVSVAAALGAVLRQTVQPAESWVVLEAPAAATVAGTIDRAAAADTGTWPEGAMLMVPLVAQGRPVGAIYLGPRRSGRPYTALDRRMLERIAAAAAPAVAPANSSRSRSASPWSGPASMANWRWRAPSSATSAAASADTGGMAVAARYESSREAVTTTTYPARRRPARPLVADVSARCRRPSMATCAPS
jgi:hypothetical protein